jgi:SH3 domain protein
MKKTLRMRLCASLTAALLLLPALLAAEARYVSDQFEVMLRTGTTTQHTILKMLPSGTRLELLEADSGNGYSKVRTDDGLEGFVLTRYLMEEAGARDQLAELRRRLSSASDEQGGLSRQVDELSQQLTAAQNTIADLTSNRDQLSAELERVKSVSARALELDQRSRDLEQQLAKSEERIRELTAENETLRKHTSRDWFLAGGGLVLFSMLLGIGLTRVRWRKRSRYSDF